MTTSTYLIDRYITMMRSNYELQTRMLNLNSAHEQHLYSLLSGPYSQPRRQSHRAPHRRPSPVGFTLFDILQSVPVTPTTTQIASSTRSVIYGTIINPPNTQCPITQTEFNPDDTITQILHCQHSFNSTEINQWWQTSPRCPICRYDIRDYTDPSGTNNSDLPASPTINNLHDSSTSISTTPFGLYLHLTNESNTTDASEEYATTPRRRPSV